jgi:hypothetical protein
MSMSMLYVHSILYVHVHAICPFHAARTRTCRINLVMHHGHRHAAVIDMEMQHEQGYAAWKNSCCLSMFMSMLHFHIHVHATYLCLCSC